LDFR
jgi:hypothetical protein